MQWAILGTIITGFFALITVMVKTRPESRRVANEGDASLRDALMKRIDKLEETQTSDRDRHAEERRADRKACDESTDELRKEIRDQTQLIAEQSKMIDGLQRQLIMFQVASARALPLNETSPEFTEMLANLDKVVRSHAPSPTLQAAEEAHHATGVTVEQVHQDEASK